MNRSACLFFALLVGLALLGAPRAGLAQTHCPVAEPDTVTTTLRPMEILIDVLANDHHPFGDAMSVTIASQPAVGSVTTYDDGTVSLALTSTPASSQLSFRYEVTDSRGCTAAADVIVTGPGGTVARPDTFSAIWGSTLTLDVLANDVGASQIIAVDPGTNPVAIAADGLSLVYTAQTTGVDPFAYTVTGPGGNSSAAVTVSTTGSGDTGRVPMAETGEIDNVSHLPQWVSLTHTFENPIVIVQPPTRYGSDPAVVRVMAVEPNRFQVRLHEAAPGDDHHCPRGANPCIGEATSYLVVEAGRWDLGFATLEADAFATDWTFGASQGAAPLVAFSEAFVGPPILLTQVQSLEDPAWVTTRQGLTTVSDFRAGLQEESDDASGHGAEILGWIAVDPSDGAWGSSTATAARPTCAPAADGSCLLPFGVSFSATPRFLASVSSTFDADSVVLRRDAISVSDVSLTLDEDEAGGGGHGTEEVSYLAIGDHGVLTALGINLPPRIADDAVTVGPQGLSYRPTVTDPDATDSFWIDSVAWAAGADLPGAPQISSDGQRVEWTPPAVGFTGNGVLEVVVRDRPSGGFRSHLGLITLSWDPGFRIDARDDHYQQIPTLIFEAGTLNPFSDRFLLANDLPFGEVLIERVFDIATTRGHAYIQGVGTTGSTIVYDAPSTPGLDRFEYKAIPRDVFGTGTGDVASVEVLVVAGNQPPVAVDDTVTIPWFATEATISDATLLGNDTDADGDPLAIVNVLDQTAHGTLTRAETSSVYTPGPLFRLIGRDRFGYTVSDPDGATATAEVVLTSTPPGIMVHEDLFEGGDLAGWDNTVVPAGGGLAVTAAAALDGERGLAVTATASTSVAFVATGAPLAENHTELFFQLDPNDLNMVDGASHTIVSAVAGSGAAFDVKLGRTDAQGYRIRAFVYRDDGTVKGTPWQPIANASTAVRVEWWAATEPGTADGGIRLHVNEAPAGERLAQDNDQRVIETVRVGIAGGLDAGTVGTFHLDSVRLWRGAGARVVLLADPFEEAGLTAWGGITNTTGGTLDVTAGAAIEGDSGLAVSLASSTGFLFVGTDPLDTVGVEAFFRFDPATLSMVAGDNHTVFSAVPATGVAADVRLGWTGSTWRLRAVAFEDDGTAHLTPWQPITGATRVRVELRLGKPNSNAGTLRLWVGDQLVDTLTGLDNDAKRVRRLRFGAAGGVDATSHGTYHLDDFRAWREE